MYANLYVTSAGNYVALDQIVASRWMHNWQVSLLPNNGRKYNEW